MSYVELHCHTNYSLLDGASHPEDMVARAKELGMEMLAITDHNGLCGAVRFYTAAREAGIKPIIGAELTLEGDFHLVLLAKNKEGYSNLSRLISYAQLRHAKNQARLDFATLEGYTSGLIALSACAKGEIASHLLAGDRKKAWQAAERYREVYGDDFWIELQYHYLPHDERLVTDLVEISNRLGIGCVAANDVHYTKREGHRLQDVLVCIRHRVTLDNSHRLRRPNSEYYLKSHGEMSSLFRRYPGAIANTAIIAARCSVDLNFAGHRLPSFDVPAGETAFSFLYRLCQVGAEERYQPITPPVARQLAHELDVIYRTNLAEYFLIVWDVMRYAKEQRIPGQGRGSAADSIVAYVLGITKVDPIRHNLLFERFLNEERVGMPDIDVDFSAKHREQVLRYVYDKYGEEYTAMVCNVVTYRARSAVRDVGKVLGFPLDLLDHLAKGFDHSRSSYVGKEIVKVDVLPWKDGEHLESGPWQQLLEICQAIDRFPRHLSIHVGGMIITGTPLVEIVPLERATMPGRVVIQWDKDSVEDAGLIKMDLLSLGMLALIHEALELIEQHRGVRLDLDRIHLDDPAVYRLLSDADTVGLFQVESRAQMQALPKTRPNCFDDIVVEVAIIRPGPLQGNMVHPYIRRKQGLEEVTYLHPKLEPVLKETLGVVLFQEQVIKVAMVIAGFRPGEADLFRRAMSRKRSKDEMEKIRGRFMEGARNNGVDEAIATEIFRQLAGFAEYGFCKSHAAAFAKTAYDSAYLKAYYAPEFYCALLNNQPMGFYSPQVIAGDARRHGVKILPADINRSKAKCTLDRGNIRLGFKYIDGLGELAANELERAQTDSPFVSLDDLCRRAQLDRDEMENLIMSGACDSFGVPRRKLLWDLKKAIGGRGLRVEHGGLRAERRGLRGEVKREKGKGASTPLPLGEGKGEGALSQSPRILPLDLPGIDEEVPLPELTSYEFMAAEYGSFGLSTGQHIMEFFREEIEGIEVLASDELENAASDTVVRVAGMVVTRQAPSTAKGHVFLTLEDEYGLINVVLRPQVYEQYWRIARQEPIILVEGILQRKDGVTNIIAISLTPIRRQETPELPEARSFR